jgi:hypothetical protein
MPVMDLGIKHEDFLMCVIDVLRYDIENVASIVKLLNNKESIGWRQLSDRDFTGEDVVAALEELVEREMVLVLKEDRSTSELRKTRQLKSGHEGVHALWFELRPEGRKAWNSWSPPKDR